MPHLHLFETRVPLVSPWHASPLAQPDTGGPHLSEEFLRMLKVYRHSGGLLRAQEVAARCKPRGGTDAHTLAGWILQRKVVSFEWLSRIWMPMFQFNRHDMSRQSGLEAVMSELTGVCDDWAIANWISMPNAWLADATPADMFANAATEVLQAARADRFVLAG